MTDQRHVLNILNAHDAEQFAALFTTPEPHTALDVVPKLVLGQYAVILHVCAGGRLQGRSLPRPTQQPKEARQSIPQIGLRQRCGWRCVSTVNYGSKDPITKTLKSFAVDLTANPTMAQLLGQVRGEKVELEAPSKISGVILGVETHKKQVGEKEFIDTDVLNLLTEEGLRSVPMDTVSRLKLVNDKLNGELKKALALLASSHDSDKKAVEISFLGKGERRVRVGYIQETPIWKTTYRLVLSEKKPLIQGWSIVENREVSQIQNAFHGYKADRCLFFITMSKDSL